MTTLTPMNSLSPIATGQSFKTRRAQRNWMRNKKRKQQHVDTLNPDCMEHTVNHRRPVDIDTIQHCEVKVSQVTPTSQTTPTSPQPSESQSENRVQPTPPLGLETQRIESSRIQPQEINEHDDVNDGSDVNGRNTTRPPTEYSMYAELQPFTQIWRERFEHVDWIRNADVTTLMKLYHPHVKDSLQAGLFLKLMTDHSYTNMQWPSEFQPPASFPLSQLLFGKADLFLTPENVVPYLPAVSIDYTYNPSHKRLMLDTSLVNVITHIEIDPESQPSVGHQSVSQSSIGHHPQSSNNEDIEIEFTYGVMLDELKFVFISSEFIPPHRRFHRLRQPLLVGGNDFIFASVVTQSPQDVRFYGVMLHSDN